MTLSENYELCMSLHAIFLLARGSKRTIRMGLGSQSEHRIRLILPTRAASHKMNYINTLLFRISSLSVDWYLTVIPSSSLVFSVSQRPSISH